MAIATQIESVGGGNLYRKHDAVDETAEANIIDGPLLNSVFLRMAEFFVKAELGTEEEAYVCIIPAFKDKMPGERESNYEETQIMAM